MDTKEIILHKARKLFAKYGYDGVSTRTICQKASCNISAISYHFGSKEELYRACLTEDGSNIIQLMDTILFSIEDEADFKAKLRIFMIQMFDYFMNNRELILMISKDVNSRLAMESIHRIFNKIPDKLTAFFKEAIEKNILRENIDPVILGQLIVHPFFMQTLFSEKPTKTKNLSDANERNYFIDQQLLIFFQGILKNRI
ncbi:MAG: TetR/AcrR family transcriptional regulator [Bacteriovoracaceae bacterium]